MLIETLGYLAGAFLLLMASMRSIFWMRVCNIAGNITFVAYGYLAGVWPVFVLNAAMIALHLWRLQQIRRSPTSLTSTQNEQPQRSL